MCKNREKCTKTVYNVQKCSKNVCKAKKSISGHQVRDLGHQDSYTNLRCYTFKYWVGCHLWDRTVSCRELLNVISRWVGMGWGERRMIVKIRTESRYLGHLVISAVSYPIVQRRHCLDHMLSYGISNPFQPDFGLHLIFSQTYGLMDITDPHQFIDVGCKISCANKWCMLWTPI